MKLNYTNRYWVFRARVHYPNGGINDLIATFEDPEEAEICFWDNDYPHFFTELWDMEERKELKNNWKHPVP